ncbi:MAG: RDD family protein [Chloroflexi bacterium]|nr:RDD family protein [Chloroflexota bacterium]
MQQQDVTPTDSGEQQEPDWVLASYGQRVGAWALDFVGFTLPFVLLLIGLFVLVLGLILSSEFVQESIETSSDTLVIEESIEESFLSGVKWFVAAMSVASVVVGVLAIVVLGYIVWWLIALGRGQTPGKQIVGIRVIKDNGEPSNWGYTFLREFVIKLLLVGFISDVTFGIGRLVDYLWPLWDRAEKMQTLHDKLLGTIVVKK